MFQSHCKAQEAENGSRGKIVASAYAVLASASSERGFVGRANAAKPRSAAAIGSPRRLFARSDDRQQEFVATDFDLGRLLELVHKLAIGGHLPCAVSAP